MFNIEAFKTSKGTEKLVFCKQEEVNGAGEETISIVPEKKYQEIIGFGGALNELGWEAIDFLDKDRKASLFEELFTDKGCDFNFCRIPVGANDFAKDAYSLNDTDGDFEMRNFSIERDKNCLIQYVKEVLKTNAGVKIWSCPWSPPYWMKTNKNMCCGGELIDTPEYLRAYAKYLVKYIAAYRAEGIPIYALCVQNEIDVVNVYPTSPMKPEVMREFIRSYLIPEFMKSFNNMYETEIWAGTIRDVPLYADKVVDDEVVKQFVRGLGYQYSSGPVVKAGYDKYKDLEFPNKAEYKGLKIIHTEAPCHNGANSWMEAKEIFEDIVMYLESGCRNYSYWNIVLNETGFSTWNWRQNSLISIDREKKEVIYNYEYYIMKHFSKFIKPGAYRIETFGDYEGTKIAFQNADGSIVCLVSNFSKKDKIVKLNICGKMLKIKLESDSIYTFKINL